MKKTKLVELLTCLSAAELQQLKKFVQSPYFNQRREVVALLDFLTPFLKANRPVPGKEKAFKAIFGDKPYDDHRIRMSISFLFKLAKQFLVVQHSLTDTPAYQLQLSGELRKRKLNTLANAEYQQTGKAIQQQAYRNADHQQQQYLFLLDQYRFQVEHRPAAAQMLQQLSDQLDHTFLSRKLWQACFMHSHHIVFNSSYEHGLLAAALAHLKDSPLLREPDIAIYYYCYQALVHPDDQQYFQAFKQLLLQHNTLFPEAEMRDLFVLAINFCIRQYNAGNSEYLSDQFDFYRIGFDQQYFLTDGQLSRYTYQNAVTIGLVMHELEWVESFIHQYRSKLPETHQESLFSFNLARLEYQRRNLDSALELVQKADYKDLLLTLAAKTLQLKIFYELDAYDLLESHIQALQTFIRRKKNLGYHRENYLNTIAFTRKLLESNPYDRQAREQLRAEIEQTKALAEKEWLLEQIPA